jgi:hypothetical protein
LRKNKEKIDNEKLLAEELKNKIKKEKLLFESSLETQRKKLEKLSNLNPTNINEYDKLKLMSGNSVALEDFDKYITLEEDANSIRHNELVDKNEILLEIEKLKQRYEDKSIKYKEIIRKLRSMIQIKKSTGELRKSSS